MNEVLFEVGKTISAIMILGSIISGVLAIIGGIVKIVKAKREAKSLETTEEAKTSGMAEGEKPKKRAISGKALAVLAFVAVFLSVVSVLTIEYTKTLVEVPAVTGKLYHDAKNILINLNYS